MKIKNGFSLVELLAVILITALLFFVALPSYNFLIRQNQLSNAINQFVAVLSFARAEAIITKQTITICPRARVQSCGADWNKGVVVLTNKKILRVFDSMPGIQITWNRDNNHIEFSSLGLLKGQNGSFKLYDKDGNSKVIVLSKTGRVWSV